MVAVIVPVGAASGAAAAHVSVEPGECKHGGAEETVRRRRAVRAARSAALARRPRPRPAAAAAAALARARVDHTHTRSLGRISTARKQTPFVFARRRGAAAAASHFLNPFFKFVSSFFW
ncbi:hypothetical protein JYU34_006147 [Plutella xylostella]|uniref:Secreted protein n=1 Tax=Plutella xylostella TaxID=51655 RepID=A0ABQ7QV59_PLUXY|nr:hypothetical protein JYU34_006147 [Plutella xylostella]